MRLLPLNKHDLARVTELLALDLSLVKPLFPELLQWLQDINWPVAMPIARFFAALGVPAVPAVMEVLRSSDHVWRYFVLEHVVAHWPLEAVSLMQPLLEQIATQSEVFEADLVALRLLQQHGLSEIGWLMKWVSFKKAGVLNQLAELEALEKQFPPEDRGERPSAGE